MDNYVLVGKIINTFGIKGELKVSSDFEYQERIWQHDFSLYIGESKVFEKVEEARKHQNYELVLLKNYHNINEVLKYKGCNIYIKRSDLLLKNNEYLLSDLIGYNVLDGKDIIGVVIDYSNNRGNILLKVRGIKTFYLPLVNYYIEFVNQEKKEIITINGKELIL